MPGVSSIMGSAKIDSLEALSKYFSMPEKTVAKELGICLTSLKKICRSYGVTRWPFRKLKSIQRTMETVSSEQHLHSHVADKLRAAGIIMDGEGGGGEAKAGGGKGGKLDKKLGEFAEKKDSKKRKPYMVNGKTVMMSEEEQKLISVSIGGVGDSPLAAGGGGLTLKINQVENDLSSTSGTPAGGLSSAGFSPVSPALSIQPHSALLYVSSTAEGTFVPAVPLFSCQAVGPALHVRNWSELWTRDHLQKRLLEPLKGTSMSIIEGGSVAVLEFSDEKVASRAQMICRAAAKAAEENLKARSRSTSQPHTPSNPTSALVDGPAAPWATKSSATGSVPSSKPLILSLDIPSDGAHAQQMPFSPGSATSPHFVAASGVSPLASGFTFGMWGYNDSALTLDPRSTTSSRTQEPAGGMSQHDLIVVSPGAPGEMGLPQLLDRTERMPSSLSTILISPTNAATTDSTGLGLLSTGLLVLGQEASREWEMQMLGGQVGTEANRGSEQGGLQADDVKMDVDDDEHVGDVKGHVPESDDHVPADVKGHVSESEGHVPRVKVEAPSIDGNRKEEARNGSAQERCGADVPMDQDMTDQGSGGGTHTHVPKSSDSEISCVPADEVAAAPSIF